MKPKKISLILLIFLLCFLNTGCSTNKSVSMDKLNVIEKKIYNFALIKDDFVDERNYFTDLAVKGLERIKNEYGAKIEIFDTNSPEDYEKRVREAAQNNDLTFASAFKFLESLNNVAKDYPNKNFAIVDTVSNLPNVKSIEFSDEEGALLMGIIAGNMTESNKVGFIGGIKNDVIENFLAGYLAGIKVSNEEAYNNMKNSKLIQYVDNFKNNEESYRIAKEMYEEGADIIFHAAGGAGLGLFKAAKEHDKYAIGVDIDAAVEFPQYANNILSSMIKNLDEAIYNAAKEVINSDFKSGPDNVMENGLKNNGIVVAESTKNLVPEDVLKIVNNYKELVIRGEIDVPKTLNEVENFKFTK